MSFILKITAGKDVGSEFTLHEGRNMVGRSRSSDVRVFNEDVSGKHFSIEIAEGRAVLQNLSGYGTRVDGILVRETQKLCSGQVIEAGKSLKLLFEMTGQDSLQNSSGMETELTDISGFTCDTQENTAGAVTEISVRKEQAFPGEEKLFEKRMEPGKEREPASDAGAAGTLAGTQTGTLLEQTSVTSFSPGTLLEEKPREAAAPEDPESKNGIEGLSQFGTYLTENTSKTGVFTNITQADVTKNDDTPTEAGNTTAGFFSFFRAGRGTDTVVQSNKSGEVQQMLFEEFDESEKTNVNDTQVVQTRMATADEIDFIKNQIRKQQQNRFFFKFLIFCLFAILLGILWVLKMPEAEKNLEWPMMPEGKQMVPRTRNIPVFGQGRDTGGFDVYCPDWPGVRKEEEGDVVVIHTFLGKKGEVPLTITLLREVSNEFVYEKREDARFNALKRLPEKMNKKFDFDENRVVSNFMVPSPEQSENGVPVDKVEYRMSSGRACFGILRFFRHGGINYIIRAEVPVEEKSRAMQILDNNTFISVSQEFQRHHWEGSDKYTRSDIAKAVIGARSELQRNSPMQYPHLERMLKSILAQAVYEDNLSVRNEAEKLLGDLRVKQQHWYNGQKIRWISAVRVNDAAEKSRIRKDCETVFPNADDKRRQNIMRGHLE